MNQAQVKRSPERDERFFTAIENGHGIAAAAAAADYNRRTVYRWKKDDPDFDERWETALEMASDLLEEEAERRGRIGWTEPVFYQGEQVGTKHKYSDALLLARLKAVRPKLYNSEAFKRPPLTSWNMSEITCTTLAQVRELLEAGTIRAEQLPEDFREMMDRYAGPEG
jgi:hypothetical protein